jgi:hypothetical protein
MVEQKVEREQISSPLPCHADRQPGPQMIAWCTDITSPYGTGAAEQCREYSTWSNDFFAVTQKGYPHISPESTVFCDRKPTSNSEGQISQESAPLLASCKAFAISIESQGIFDQGAISWQEVETKTQNMIENSLLSGRQEDQGTLWNNCLACYHLRLIQAVTELPEAILPVYDTSTFGLSYPDALAGASHLSATFSSNQPREVSEHQGFFDDKKMVRKRSSIELYFSLFNCRMITSGRRSLTIENCRS